ncbi:MAG TPA: motility protein A [Acidimicrobiia bacterium]|nr:motility protein A [Acidimicrobiia bacterium]
MEKGTMVGLGVTLFGVFVSAIMHGIQPVFLFMEFGSLIIVFGGCFGATITSFPFAATQNLGKYIQKAMKGDEPHSASETIGQIVLLTNRARAEGLLALEEEAKKIEDPFFRKGIELAVDGTDPEALKKTLFAEITAMKERHKVGQNWMTQAGVFAPTFGIIGAVFGLMATMAKLDQPSEVGHGIAGAFVATFWGVFLANGIFLPIANKLKQFSQEEVAHKMLIVEGIMAIQAGISPRVIEEMLKSHVPPAEREAVGQGQAEAA